MEKTFKNLFRFSLDLLFPKLCLGCRQEGSFLCEQCLKILPIQKSAVCFFCQKRSPDGSLCSQCKEKYHSKIDGVFVASDWENLLLKEIIYRYKYSFIKELAIPLSELMINFLEINKPINWKIDQLIFTPVPLSRRRLAWRGFNQAKTLAEIVGKKFEIEMKEILERRRFSLPQAEIKDKKTRRENIAGVFGIKSDSLNSNLKNKTIILVDDISTTGATLFECAEALKVLKPERIFGLVVARG